MGVIPHVGAGPLAAADTLPRPEAPVLPPLAGPGRQIADRRVQPEQQPPRQRAILIERLVPFLRVAGETVVIVEDVVGDVRGAVETISVLVTML